VFERAPATSDVGAGIMLQTSGMLALRRLGLERAVAAVGEELRVGHSATDDGKTLTRTSLSFLEETFGVPTVALHRARLQTALRDAIPDVPVHLGRRLTDFAGDEAGVTASFADGTTARGALLVGADGVHSVVRDKVLGAQPLRYAGYTSWRGIALIDEPCARHTITEMWGRGARFGFTSIGGGEVYWFAVLDAPPGEKDDSPLEAVSRHFRSFSQPVPRLLLATPPSTVLRTDIYDRPPVPSWSGHRVTLLGDAAHPTTPNLGRGGGMAIEDAVVLAYALSNAPTIGEALAVYERERVAPTSAIVVLSRRFGQIGQLRTPVAVWLRNVMIRLTPDRVLRSQLLKQAAFTLPDERL